MGQEVISVTRETAARSGRERGAGKKNGRAERRAKRWLRQLIGAAALFALVFVGSGLVPARVMDVGAKVRSAITRNVDFPGSMRELGEALAAGTPAGEAVEAWCAQVFDPGAGTDWTPVTIRHGQAVRDELAFLAHWDGSVPAFAAHTMAGTGPETAQAQNVMAPYLPVGP